MWMYSITLNVENNVEAAHITVHGQIALALKRIRLPILLDPHDPQWDRVILSIGAP